MTRFFTHVLYGREWVRDLEGIERPDLETVRLEALKGARELLAADVRSGRLNLDGAIAVEDEKGVEVHRLLFRDAVVASGL